MAVGLLTIITVLLESDCKVTEYDSRVVDSDCRVG